MDVQTDKLSYRADVQFSERKRKRDNWIINE